MITFLVAATLGAAFSCDSGRTPSSAATNQRGSRIWFTLYSHQRESARFVSIDEDRQTLYVEATSPNLELASVISVARGRLAAATLGQLSEALRGLGRMDPAGIASMQPIEPIEQSDLLADVATSAAGATSSWPGLATKAMPPDVSAALTHAAAAASKLAPHRPPSIVQAIPVDAARAERIRTDPRKPYQFVPVEENVLNASPHLLAALRHPGLVVETSESEDLLVRDWLRLSNPKRTSDTLFVEIEGDTLRAVFQMHVREVSLPRRPIR